MNDDWPEPEDENPDEPVPGGPEDDEPDRPTAAMTDLAGLQTLTAADGTAFEFCPAIGTRGDEVWREFDGLALEVVPVTTAADQVTMHEVDGARVWRLDWSAKRKSFKVSPTGKYALLSFDDGEERVPWTGVA